MIKLTLETSTIELIRQEINNIPEKYQKKFNSTHEGYAILKEEVDELWEEIKNGEKRIKKQLRAENDMTKTAEYYHKMAIRSEAIQVAAMACRIIQELTNTDSQ